MDQAHMNTLWHIFDKAISHAETCISEESPHSASEWMSVARDADHIIRKHEEMEEENSTVARAR